VDRANGIGASGIGASGIGASGIGASMRFLFRPGTVMIALYIALVSAYGFISIFARAAPNEEVRKLLTGFIWASTILHFYYDGFIWKVREKSVRESLGLNGGQAEVRSQSLLASELVHGLKWAPFLVLLGWLSFAEFTHSSPPPPGMERRVWPNESYIRWNENISQAIPNSLDCQARLAAILDNCGRTEEAKSKLWQAIEKDPTFVDGHLMLGKIHSRLAEWSQAIEHYRAAIQHNPQAFEQIEARFCLGEAYQRHGDLEQAHSEFQQLLQISPAHEPAANALHEIERALRVKP
jgi:hypothetical protein